MSPARSPLWAFVAMVAAASMILVDQTAVPLTISQISHDLSASATISSWVLTAELLSLSVFLVFGGRLADMFGQRRIFVTGAAVFVVASAAAGAAPNIDWLILARVVQGFGAALMMPATLAITAAVYPASRRGRMLGLLGGISTIFSAIGPLIGGQLVDHVSWRAVFYINVPIAIIAILLALAFAPAVNQTGTRERLDFRGLVLFAVAFGGLVFALGQGSAWGWMAPAVLTGFGVGAISLAAFCYLELRSEHPLMHLRLLKIRNFLAASIAQFGGGIAEMGLGALLPVYIVVMLGLSAGEAGIVLLAESIPMVVVAPLVGRLYDRWGGRELLALGFVCLAGGITWLGLVADVRPDVWILVPPLMVMGIGLVTVLTAADPVAIDSVDLRRRGEASGFSDTAEQLGGAVGVAMVWAVYHIILSWRLGGEIAKEGVQVTSQQIERFREIVIESEDVGFSLEFIPDDLSQLVWPFAVAGSDAFSAAMYACAAIAVVCAVATFALVKRGPSAVDHRVKMRRWRGAAKYLTQDAAPG